MVIGQPSDSRRRHLAHMLSSLTQWKTPPHHLAVMAHEWCSAICEKYQDLDDGETLPFLSLQVGFRHQDIQERGMRSQLVHTQHHRSMVDVVFGSQEDEVIADLPHAWTSQNFARDPPALPTMCAKYLVDLLNLGPSSRLRRLIVRPIGLIELIGYQEFEKVRVEDLLRLWDHLDAGVDDMDCGFGWS